MGEYNIYCDESCHLPNDDSNIMVIGGVLCPKDKARQINEEIQSIKNRNKVYKYAELKWTKVSQSRLQMFKELVDLFFNYSFLSFRGVVALNKKELDCPEYNLTYDDWYYRIYYLVLKELVNVGNIYNIFIDRKDTKGQKKVVELQKVLNRTLYDFYDETVTSIQRIESHQVCLMQLSDILIGALSYKSRGKNNSKAKLELIDYIEKKINHSLSFPTNLSESKFNIFYWSARRNY